MKLRSHIFLFVSCALVLLSTSTCSHRPTSYTAILANADRLTATAPDSAISLLRNLEKSVSNASEEDQMYYKLLKLKAGDKAYIKLTSDSVVTEVINYFKSKQDHAHLPEAYFYAGQVIYELGNTEKALDCFRNALKEIGQQGIFLALKSKVLNQMGALYSEESLFNDAYAAYKEAIECNTMLGNRKEQSNNLNAIAATFLYKAEMDSALHYYRLALDIAQNDGDEDLINRISVQMARIYMRNQQLDSIPNYISKAVRCKDSQDRDAAYLLAAEYYHKRGQTDSTAYYYTLLKESDNIHAHRMASYGLSMIELSKENPKEAFSVLYQYFHNNNLKEQYEDDVDYRQIESHFKYMMYEKENMLLKSLHKQHTIIIISVVLITLLVLVFIWSIRGWRRRRLNSSIQLLENLKHRDYVRSDEYISRQRKEIQSLEKQLRQDEGQSDSLRQELQRLYENYKLNMQRAELAKAEKEIAKKNLQNSEAYQQMMRCIDHDKQPTKEQWKALEEAVNQEFFGFTSTLKSIYPINTRQLHICLLQKAEFSRYDIPKLMGMSMDETMQLRKQITARFIGKNGTLADLAHLIDGI